MADGDAASPPGAAPPGRRERSKAANRIAILDAARAVFGELGFGAATVRDIVRRTGLSVGAFYNYFRSKEEVYAALADDGARRFRPRLRAVHDATPDFETYVARAVRAYFEFLVEEEDDWRARQPAEGPRQPTVRAETPEMMAVFDEVRADIAAAARRDGPDVDADYLAGALIAVTREVGDRMLERRPIDVDGAVAFTVRLLLQGCGGWLAREAPR